MKCVHLVFKGLGDRREFSGLNSGRSIWVGNLENGKLENFTSLRIAEFDL